MTVLSTIPENKPMSSKPMHIAHQPTTLHNWYKKINWLNTTLVVLIPTFGLYLTRTTPLTRPTLLWSILYYFCTAFSITGGYHRLWSHRCYSARLPLRIFLAFTGAGAIQGSIRWWSANHRAHHRWTDTMKDPYSVMRGLLFSHIGWLVLNNDPKVKGRTDISDLDSDAIVVWQHKHYGKCLLFAAWGFPMLVAGLGWGDWWGGLVYAGIVRACFVQQATFCVNSLAHWIGEQPFDDRRSPRDHVLTALVTMGEGYVQLTHMLRNSLLTHKLDITTSTTNSPATTATQSSGTNTTPQNGSSSCSPKFPSSRKHIASKHSAPTKSKRAGCNNNKKRSIANARAWIGVCRSRNSLLLTGTTSKVVVKRMVIV